MWAYNPLSVRGRGLAANYRLEIWMSVDAFMERYGMEEVEPRAEIKG